MVETDEYVILVARLIVVLGRRRPSDDDLSSIRTAADKGELCDDRPCC